MKVGLIGTYDVDNFGDCLFPEVYVRELQRRIPGVEFELFSPRAKAAEILTFKHVSALPRSLDELDEIRCDALVLTGGETIRVGHSQGTYIFPLSTFSAGLRLWLAPLLVSSTRRVPFALHCVGLAPAIPGSLADISHALGSASAMTVRDSFSQNILLEHGLDCKLATDPMFNTPELLPQAEWARIAMALLPPGYQPRNYIVAQISAPYLDVRLSEWCAGVAELSRREKLDVLLLPICHFLKDELVLERAVPQLERLGVKVGLVCGRINVKETAAVISQAAGYCGTSLHGAVIATSFGVPAVVKASTQGKHAGVLATVGIHGVVTPDPGSFSSCFERSAKMDLKGIRASASIVVDKELDSLASCLTSGTVAGRIDPAVVRRILEIDRSTVRGLQAILRRTILRGIQRSQTLSDSYFLMMHSLRGKFG